MTLRVLLATAVVLAAAGAPTAAEMDRRGPRDASGTTAASVAQASPATLTRLRGRSERSARSLAGFFGMLTPEQEARFTAAFSELDADGDGAISSEELALAARGELAVAASPPGQNCIAVDLLQSFVAVDVDASGDVTLDEFAVFAQGSVRLGDDRDLAITQAFLIFDYDGDCLSSADEYRSTLRSFYSLTADQIEFVVAFKDVDGDGQIDLDEFAATFPRF